MEHWKDIRGYEGTYQVSDAGRIKSIGRVKYCGKNVVNGAYYKEKILKGNPGRFGYLRVNLWKNNRCKMHKIHQIVAKHFIPNTNNLSDINHKDGIKSNNAVSNLEWMNRSDNLKHAYRLGLKKAAFTGKKGRDHHNSKAVKQFDLAGNLVNVFHGQAEAQRETGILQSTISGACSGKYKTAGKFKWEYA